jgi:tetratricopeptide (TPR) repeat protein/transcriptional regulator with XRE-family HTH domain
MPYQKTSLRREKRDLREKMRGLGLDYRDIAAEFARRYNLRPRAAWREAYGWSLQDTADRINDFRGQVGLDPGGLASMTAPHLSEYENWPGHGSKPTGRRPTPYLLALLATAYDCTVTDLIDLADREQLPAADLLVLDKYTQPAAQTSGSTDEATVGISAGPVAGRVSAARAAGESPMDTAGLVSAPDPGYSDGTDRVDGRDFIAVVAGSAPPLARKADSEGAASTIAGESADFAASEAARTVTPMSVIQLTAELERLARHYADIPPVEMLDQARRLRDESHRLSQRTRVPAQLADLHLVTGAACGLLARSSWDLGEWLAAIEQAHAAGIYGELIGHGALQAWAAGTEALIAFWRGRPRDAVDAVTRGLQLAPMGTPRARLHCIAARAWAYVGAIETVHAELASADQALGQAGGLNAEVLHDEIAGEYSWNQARHAMCAATALLVAGDLDRAAARAREAINVRTDGRASDHLVSAKAYADLACIELASGHLDAAQHALGPVWNVAPQFRPYPLIGRLESAANALTKPRYARSRSASDLGERIRGYCDASAPALVSRQMLAPGG